MKNRYAVFEAPKTNSLFVRIFILLACLTLSFAAQANAQAVGDYRSTVAVFNWNAVGNWERWNGSTWVLNPIEGYPGQNPGTGTVTIRNGATVTINVTPANSIGGLVVGEGTSGTLQFDNANRTLNVGSGGVTVNANGTFRVAMPVNPNNNTHTINISGGGSFINNGTVNFREVSGGNTDVANINLSGNLSGSGTSTFNNITFNGTNNQLIDIVGTINNVQAVTYNNTGTAPNNQITNQSAAFTNALTTRQTAAGATNISTFTAGNYRHDVNETYLASNAGITVGTNMTVTALQGTMNFAHGTGTPVLTLNGALVVNGGTVNAGVNTNTTSEFGNSLNMGAVNASITLNSGTLNVGNTATGYGNLRMNANNQTITINGGTLRTERWVIGSGTTDNHVVTINGGLVQILPTVTTTNRVALQFVQGTLTMNGGVMRIGESLTSITGANLVQLSTVGNVDQSCTFTINQGSVIVAGNPGFTSVAAVNPFNLGTGGTGTANVTLTVGDGLGGPNTAELQILPNLAPQLPTPATRNILDMDAALPDVNQITVNSDGYIKVGGGNIGNLRLNNTGCSVTMSGGTVDVTASVQLGNGATFTVGNGTLNIGTSTSDGTNTINMPVDAAAVTRFIVNGGTVNVGDGNSSLGIPVGSNPLSANFGNDNNTPAFASANYASFEITGGTFNLNGRFTLNDANYRFIMSGGAFNINPKGDQDLTGAQNVLSFNRGIVQHSGGTITIVNPHPNAGGNNTTVGVTFRTSALGNPATGVFITGSTTPSSDACFTGTSTIRFGDGVSSVPGSTEGYEVCLAPTLTYNNFEVNNPSGSNRFVWLYTPTDNQTLNFNGNFNLIAGEVRQGRPAAPSTPNVFVNSTGSGIFTLANNTLYAIYNTNPGNPAPSYGTSVNYSIDFNSTIEYVSNVTSGQTVSLPASVEFGNLTISGTGNRTVSSGNAVRNTLTLNQGVLIVGTGNLTMRNNSRLVRAGTDAQGIINTGNTLGQAAGDLFRIIYRGVSKNFRDEEFTGAGRKSLEVDLNVGETVTQNVNRTIVDLFLTQGTLNDGGNALSVEGNISGNATHVSTGSGRVQMTGTGAQTISDAPNLDNFRLDKSSGTTTLSASASPTINGIFDIVQDNNFLDVPDNAQLNFGLSASISGTFNNLRMIRLTGLTTALGVRKRVQAGTNFTFPIGVGTRYTPARLTVNAATGSDFLTVTPIASEAPTNSSALALQYYWRVTQGTGITITNISHAYQYVNSDVEAAVADTAIYQAGRFNTATAQWTALTIDEVDGNRDLDGNLITTGGRIRFPNVNYAEGLFTAGEGAKFNNGTVVAYYSVPNATGDWTLAASWRTGSFLGPAATAPPGFDNPVFIGQNGIIFLNVALPAAVPSVTILSDGRLRLEVNPGSVSFGSVSGEGTLELRDDDNNGIQFPVGNFTSFLSTTGGTVEYGGAQDYTLPNSPTGYRNLVISGNGTTKTFPGEELTISGNLTVQDGATALLSNQTDGDIFITGAAAGGGNLTVTGTGSVLRFTNDNERTVEVRRNVTIGAGATLDVATTGTAVPNLLIIGDNTSALGGNLTNDGIFDMNAGGGRVTNVQFRGIGNTSITGSGSTTEFHRLIVNKGSDQTATLTVPDVATLANFALTAPANVLVKPLGIQNGTFIFNRPTATLELSSGGGNFVIPTTVALQVGGGTVQLSSTGGHDLILNGRLRITGGVVNIGTDVSGLSQNSIIYESPSAELLVEGGTLTVATGIRANGGALNYTQSGGTVTVGRYSTEDGFPIFGIAAGTNAALNMTGPSAVLNIVRGKNSFNTNADLLIANVASPTSPQGTIQIFTGDTPQNAVTGPLQLGFIYDINSAVRLPNVSIGVGQPINYNVGARNGAGAQTLDIRGNLTINTLGTCEVRLWRINGVSTQDIQSVTVAGDFTLTNGTIVMGNTTTFNVRGNFVQNNGNLNQGATPNANLLVGGNFTLAGGTFNTFVNTTFNGTTTTTQVILRTGGSPNPLTFQNFTINNTATGGIVQLGVGTDLNITGDWTRTAGTFDAETNTRTVTFNGSAAQTITGTTDFYNLTINNANGVTLASGTLGIRSTPGSGGTLTLTNGVLNIGNNPLIIRNTDATGVIGGTPSASAMVSTSGTAAAVGVTKVYGGAQSFTFPIGTASPFAIYTPATINVTNLGTGGAGSITVAPVRAAHPQASTATGRIFYYWRTTQSGFAEESAGFSVTHTYVATTAVGNLGGNLANYVGAYYIGSPTFQWNFLPVPPNTPDVSTFDEGTFTIGAPTAGTTNRISGEFTAGEGLVNPIVYYSYRSGNWDVVTGIGTTTWSTDPVSEIPPGTLPNAGNPVVIRSGHVVNTNGSGRLSATLTFQTGGGTLEISSASTGHNFGTILSAGGAPGTIRFVQNVAAAPTFPTATLDPSFFANGTIDYSGTGSYTIPTGAGVPNPYPNLTFSGSGTKTLPAGATNIDLNLTLSGSVTVAMGTNTMNRTSVGGTMTMGAGTTLTLTGANNFPANFSTYSLAPTSTVDYTANAAQTIASLGGQPYGNLTLTKTGGTGSETKTLAGNTVVAGNLLVRRTGGTGNLTFATDNFDLTVGGNFTLNNALPVTQFNGGTSTVTFNGATDQNLTRTGGGAISFHNLTLNKPSGRVVVNAANTAITVPNTLTLTSGTLDLGAVAGTSLTLNGTIAGSGLLRATTANTDLTITGTGTVGTLNFETGFQGLRRFTLNRTGTNPTVTLGTNLTVGQGVAADSLYLLNGIIQTGTNTLTLANQAQFGHGSANAFVDGALAITYPTGTDVSRFFAIAGDGIYRPLLVRGNPTAGAVITARMINTPPPGSPGAGLNNISSVRYYQINRTGTFGGTPRVQLSINTTSVDEFATNPGGLTVASTTDNPPAGSTVWQAGGNPSASFTPAFPAAIMSADITSISSSSPVFVTAASTVPNDNPLPVELISFAITAERDGVKLKWETASEVENAGFILSRSRSRETGFEEIASYRTTDALVGKGTSATGGTYEFVDRTQLLPGETYYYQLQDVDFNGAIHTTEVKEFTMPKAYSLSQNYPNPFNPSTTIEFNLRYPGQTALEIYNLLGQKVMTVVEGNLAAGSYRYQVNLSGLSSGMYLYRLRSNEFVATKKMLLVK